MFVILWFGLAWRRPALLARRVGVRGDLRKTGVA